MDTAPSHPPATDGQVVFNGRAGEYFGIWTVNIVLMLLTLGIYSAWAKVRTRQYFYASTRVGGAAFDYLARPTRILIGRLIAVAVLVAYTLVSELLPVTQPWLLMALLTLLPWVIVRSLAFNARNSAHRGLRFNFHGGYWRALLGYLLLPLLGLLTAGLLLPVGAWYRAHFLVGHTSFGATRFALHQPLTAFYRVYGRALLLALALFVPVLVALVLWYGGGLVDDIRLVPRYMEQSGHEAAGETGSDDSQSAAPEGDAPLEPPLSEQEMEGAEKLLLAFLTLIYPLLALVAVVWIYIRTALTNLTWNGARLGPIAFHMRLRFGRMLWLKTSNLLAIVLSFGLAIPWARIRMARYVTGCLQVLGLEHDYSLLGAARERGNVLGEELGEAFDLDLGL